MTTYTVIAHDTTQANKILLLFFLNCPWYPITKGEEIKKIVIKN